MNNDKTKKLMADYQTALQLLQSLVESATAPETINYQAKVVTALNESIIKSIVSEN